MRLLIATAATQERRGAGGADPAGAPVLYAPDGPRLPGGRADGTRPRHLSFPRLGPQTVVGGQSWSEPALASEPGAPARRQQAPCPGRRRKMWTNTPHETRCCCSGCSGCSCCGWLSGRCPGCCSRTRRAAHGINFTSGPTGGAAGEPMISPPARRGHTANELRRHQRDAAAWRGRKWGSGRKGDGFRWRRDRFRRPLSRLERQDQVAARRRRRRTPPGRSTWRWRRGSRSPS